MLNEEEIYYRLKVNAIAKDYQPGDIESRRLIENGKMNVQNKRLSLMIMMICICDMVNQGKTFYPFFQSRPLSSTLSTANILHVMSKTLPCAELDFSLCSI